jgi:long-chain fatty acid transport protein
VIAVGLAYDVSDDLRLIVDADWEDWSEFSNNYVSIQGGEITSTIERNWEDTWHVGIAALYKMTDSMITAGLGYDSSPVDDEYRTFDLPIDEQYKFGMAYGWISSETRSYSIGLSYVWLGDGKIDQVTQGSRVKGEFDTNYFVSIGGNARFLF